MSRILQICVWTVALLLSLGTRAESPTAPSMPSSPTPPPGKMTLALASLADRPQNLVLTTNLDPAREVLITLTAENFESVLDLAKTLAEINKDQASPLLLRVFFPESFGPLAVKQKPQVLEQVNRLRRELKRARVPEKNVEFQPHTYLQYSWLQDLGEFFWYQKPETKNWSLGFLDVNRGNRGLKTEEWPLDSKSIFKNDLPLEEPLLLVHALKQFYKLDLLRLPVIKRNLDFDSLGNQGGNLEVLPGGIPLLGDAAPPELLQFLEENTGKKPLSVPSRFLQVPQVDQIFSIIPTPNSCGFSLLTASPLWGAQLLKNERLKKGKRDERLAESLFFFANSSEINLEKRLSSKDFDPQRETRKYDPEEFDDEAEPLGRYFDVIVQRTLQAQVQIETGAQQIRDRLKSEKVCENVEVIEVPVLPSFPAMEDYFDSEARDEKPLMVFQTPTPNLLVLNDHLILANFDQSPTRLAAQLKQLTLKQLENSKVPAKRIHFVRAGAYVDGTGAIHSGTLVLRSPSAINSTPSAEGATPKSDKTE